MFYVQLVHRAQINRFEFRKQVQLIRIEIDNLPKKQGVNMTFKKKITPK